MVVATAAIGRLRHALVLPTRVAFTSLVVSSIQPITSIGSAGLVSDVSFRLSSRKRLIVFSLHLSETVLKNRLSRAER